MPAVIAQDLVKRYGSLLAVDHLSFEVASGTCFGSLGPNGAGKTTLIRLLSGLIRPTSGTIEVAGYDVRRHPDSVRRGIGVVSQAMTTDLDLSGRENLDIYARYYNVPLKTRRERIDNLLDQVGLVSRIDDLVATYSGGMRRRLEIARGLIHRPKILFLDEPTMGLDPQSRRVVWGLLKRFLQDEALTIFLTTHYMDEADFLCDQIAIIDHGKISVMETPEALKSEVPGGNMIEAEVIWLHLKKVKDVSIDTLISTLTTCSFVQQVVQAPLDRDAVSVRLQIHVNNGPEAIPILIQKFREQHFQVQTIGLKRPSLEDVFIHYTGRSIREEGGQKVNFFIGAGVPRRMGG